MILRDYQQTAVDTIWGALHKNDAALCVASTGSGKTECFIEIVRRALEKKPDAKFCILVQKINLAEQTIERFKKVIGSVSVYSASIDRDLSKSVIIATIQSISKVKVPGLNCVIIDECHNADLERGRYADFLKINNHSKLKLIGFTATPYTSRGYIYGSDKIFKQVDFNITLPDLISRGYLVRPIAKRVDHQHDTSKLRIRAGEFRQEDVDKLTSNLKILNEQIQDAIPRLAERRSAVWACASIKHCEDVTESLKSIGEKAVALHSNMTKDERANAQFAFENGLAKHLVFVSIVSEGYDHPPIDAIVIMRPIRSPTLYVQTCGRGLRLSKDKLNCLILDYGRVVETLGPLDKPMISATGRSSKNEAPAPMKFCPACLSYIPVAAMTCPDCNHEFERPKPRLESRSSGLDLLSSAPKKITVDITGVKLSQHLSKNGNQCLKIEYITTDFSQYSIPEYFVFSGNDFAYKKMVRRLIELEIKLASSLETQIKQTVGKSPKKLIYQYEDRYPRVEKLIF